MTHSVSNAVTESTSVTAQLLPGIGAPMVHRAVSRLVLPHTRTLVATAVVTYVAIKVVPMIYRTYKWRNRSVRAQRRSGDNVTRLPETSLAKAA